jgi:hypothetical protein
LEFSAETTTPKGAEGAVAGAAMTEAWTNTRLKMAINITVKNVRTKTSKRAPVQGYEAEDRLSTRISAWTRKIY